MVGLVVGVITFLLIGLFHPIVIKAEYHFGTGKPNIFFVLFGILFIALSIVFNKNTVLSIIFGVVACCCFWSIKEMKEQEERVLKGWFPENPSRSDYYESKRPAFLEKIKNNS